MRFTLREFQKTAVARLLDELDTARTLHARGKRYASTLSAPTGAGKTVMAAAVIEALLHGSADLGVEPMRNATVLWVSEDPSLNRQTKARIAEAASRIAPGQLVEVDATFDQEKLDAGKVYFLNTDKLGVKGRLSRTGDGRSHTMWQTIAATATDPGRFLVLLVDEAHQGFAAKNATTIISRLVGESADVGPVPMVLGISATPDRFSTAMRGTGRMQGDEVTVSAEEVRASGLIKDEIVAVLSTEGSGYKSTYLRAAAAELAASSDRWAQYTAANDLADVHPLLVVQVADKTPDRRIAEMVTELRDTWPELDETAFIHTFDTHLPIDTGNGAAVPYLAPEAIAARQHVRVAFTKVALATGWDCPRAEVMYSERSANDAVLIAQTLGRLARTPLARSVPSDERLNRVRAWLPEYRREAVEAVVKALRGDRVDTPFVRDSADYLPIDDAAALEALAAVPSYSKPDAATAPVSRAFTLARFLTDTELEPDAQNDLADTLMRRLDAAGVEFGPEVSAAADAVLRVDADAVSIRLDGASEASGIGEAMDISDEDVNRLMDASKRRIPEGVIADYVEHLYDTAEAADGEADLTEIKVYAVAMAGLQEVREAIDRAADAWAQQRFDRHRPSVANLSAERRGQFESIQHAASGSVLVPLALPDVMSSATVTASGVAFTEWDGHVYVNDRDTFAAKLTSWEADVLTVEFNRAGFRGWYRNPSSGRSSVAVRGDVDGEVKLMHPDFVFLFDAHDGGVNVAIVDPHLDKLADSLWKLKALSAYAEAHSEQVSRVESVVRIDDGYVVLNHLDERVRAAVRAFDGDEVAQLFRQHGSSYV